MVVLGWSAEVFELEINIFLLLTYHVPFGYILNQIETDNDSQGQQQGVASGVLQQESLNTLNLEVFL